MPYSLRAILGKSRLSISFLNSALCSDHWASEISKSPILPAAGWPETSAAHAGRIPETSAAPPATVALRNVLRVVDDRVMGAVSGCGFLMVGGAHPTGSEPGLAV